MQDTTTSATTTSRRRSTGEPRAKRKAIKRPDPVANDHEAVVARLRKHLGLAVRDFAQGEIEQMQRQGMSLEQALDAVNLAYVDIATSKAPLPLGDMRDLAGLRMHGKRSDVPLHGKLYLACRRSHARRLAWLPQLHRSLTRLSATDFNATAREALERMARIDLCRYFISYGHVLVLNSYDPSVVARELNAKTLELAAAVLGRRVPVQMQGRIEILRSDLVG